MWGALAAGGLLKLELFFAKKRTIISFSDSVHIESKVNITLNIGAISTQVGPSCVSDPVCTNRALTL